MDEDDAVRQISDEGLDCDISGCDLVIQPGKIELVHVISHRMQQGVPFREGLLLDIDPLLLEQYHGCISPGKTQRKRDAAKG